MPEKNMTPRRVRQLIPTIAFDMELHEPGQTCDDFMENLAAVMNTSPEVQYYIVVISLDVGKSLYSFQQN